MTKIFQNIEGICFFQFFHDLVKFQIKNRNVAIIASQKKKGNLDPKFVRDELNARLEERLELQT